MTSDSSDIGFTDRRWPSAGAVAEYPGGGADQQISVGGGGDGTPI
jgi:hypothetical protein